MPFFVWLRIAVGGRSRNLAQGAGSAKTGTAVDRTEMAVASMDIFISYLRLLSKRGMRNAFVSHPQ